MLQLMNLAATSFELGTSLLFTYAIFCGAVLIAALVTAVTAILMALSTTITYTALVKMWKFSRSFYRQQTLLY